jgi:hypothetical protein
MNCVKEADDVGLRDQIRTVIADKGIDLALELTLILSPTALVRFGVALDVGLAEFANRRAATACCPCVERIAAFEDDGAQPQVLLTSTREADLRVGADRQLAPLARLLWLQPHNPGTTAVGGNPKHQPGRPRNPILGPT